MSDVRELVLVRLLAIAATVPNILNVYRNETEISETKRPAIVIFDADEAADDGDPMGRPIRSPRTIGMTPEIYILANGKATEVGPALNAFRLDLLRLILTDSALAAILGTNGKIRYEGCATGLSRGRSMEGEMGLSLTFSYYLEPNRL